MTPTEKLEWRLIEAFAELGYIAEHPEITPVPGYWKQQDVYRWEGRLRLNGKSVEINSWDPVTRCVKKGDIELQEVEPWEWTVHAPP